jgi:outer membrane protein
MKILQALILSTLMIALPSFGCFANEPEPPTPTEAKDKVATQSEEEDSESFWEVEFGFVVGIGRSSVAGFNQSRHGNLIREPWFSGGYYNGNFFIETDPANGKPLTIGYTGFESDTVQLNFIATPAFVGFDDDMQKRGDSLTGIEDRSTSLDAGFELMSTHPFGQVGVRGLWDVSGVHEGFSLSTAYGYPVYLDKMVIWPSVTVTYINSAAADYYYGINPNEARIDRPIYQASGGLFTKLNLYLEYELPGRASLIGFSHYTISNDSIHQSPLVTYNTSFTVGMGIIWTF